MNMTYYPGCSLQGTARDYNETILTLFNHLGINLVEIPDWNCCGASSAHMTNHEVAMRLSMRNLQQIHDSKDEVLIPCAACFQRMKVADKKLKEDPVYWDYDEYNPQFNLVHISSFLARPEILSKISNHTKQHLNQMKLACYYGCLSLRPPHMTDSSDHEMPTSLEQIVSTIGGEPVSWTHRTECCSGSLTMTRPDIAEKLVGDIVTAAKRAGACGLITDCPMCQANVESRQIAQAEGEQPLPVFYATELIMAALQGEYPEKQKKVHLVSADILEQHLASANSSTSPKEDSP